MKEVPILHAIHGSGACSICINELERVGCPQPQSCPPAWEQDEMLIDE